MEYRDKRLLVVGSGISGISAAGLLSRKGAHVYLFDSNEKLKAEDIRKKLGDTENVDILIGGIPQDIRGELDGAVLSPGVPVDSPLVVSLKDEGITIIGEIELAYSVSGGGLIAITGTNGKTTTTSLVGEICRNYCASTKGEAYVVGNIGSPYADIADKTTYDCITVAEISSFQLETIDTFAPRISAILNITPDHLNRHKTMENYVKIKERIAENQTEDDTLVLNYDDPYTRDFGKRAKPRVIYFTREDEYASDEKVADIVHLSGDIIMYNDIPVIGIHEMQLLGTHNQENVMAAIAMTYAYGIPMDIIRDTIRSFKAVEHRIEYVRTVRGVDYYNDSKGTNPDAAIKGILAMVKKTILIGGGYDKQSEYDEWIEAFGDKVRYLILMGETAGKIADCAKAHGFTDIIMVSSMEEAVSKAYELSKPDEAVLLSPACASWDMFKSYEERGRIFKELVKELEE